MTLAIAYSRACAGLQAPLVTVEVHLSSGMAGLHIVGLPATAVKESKDRVRSALMHAHFEFPVARVTINLAPADLPKEGGRFDLAIALGILAASGQIPLEVLKQYEVIGELALSGELRPVRGVLPTVLAASKANRALIVPLQNAQEASFVEQAIVMSASHLLQVCAHLQGVKSLSRCQTHLPIAMKPPEELAEVKGQVVAKRALEIAAAGRHGLLYVGPPGTGKTMLAYRLPGLLPAISDQQALEVAAMASVSSMGFDPQHWKVIPFRSPHHTSSAVALVGGGAPPRPGEISLAHNGVLFLDELPEFNRHVLESLREPMEAGQITISRAASQASFPADFQLIACMNPCPCGHAGSQTTLCQCRPEQIRRYMSKISGPLLDRIDMHVEVARLSVEVLSSVTQPSTETTAMVKQRVSQARERQWARQGKCNAQLSVGELERFSGLTTEAKKLLNQVIEKRSLSARLYYRIVRVARTISDLQEGCAIEEQHVSEVLQYRCLDRPHPL